MADLAAANVTVTIQKAQILRGSPGHQARNIVKIAFGDGALTYPANGVPLPDYTKFAMRKRLDYIIVIDYNDASGIVWKYDYENKKLRAWLAPAQTHAHDLKAIAGGAGDGALSIETTGGPILRIETIGADQTIAGADSATKGGVISATLAAAAGTELGNVAVAAQVIYAEAVGF